MPSLKSFRLRIRSVQSTQKITKAMKMVAAAKLRRAQEQAMAARPYAEAMDKVLAALGQSFKGTGPKLLAGTGSDRVQLVIVATSDRGLCGAFNSSIVREARRLVRQLTAEGKTVKILAIGRKARDQLRRDFGPLIIDTITELGKAARDGAGWHVCLDGLEADLDGRPAPAMPESWQAIHPSYVSDFGPDASTIGPPQ